MKIPFPGMDPYLERHWGDVHQALVTYIRDQLQPSLPGDLRARMQERVDIVIHLDNEPVTEGYIEIVDVKSGHRVITSIEVLSPANKHAGEGQRLFVKKREDMQRAGVNMVEIDLLRGGERVLMIPRAQIPPSHRTDYQVCAWRAAQPGSVLLYRVPLRERLPVIAIPLRPSDPDALLDIQAVVDQCYRNGGYDDIDYTDEPEPRLRKGDAAWANTLLKEQGQR
jgi:hypothetical protein